MLALSIRQPFAWLICMGLKDVENRSWLPLDTSSRRIYVHAGKRPAGKNYNETKHITADIIQKIGGSKTKAGHFVGKLIWGWNGYDKTPWYGAIIGEVDIVEVGHIASPWAVPGQWQYLFANPTLYDKPIPMRGKLGFFEVSGITP